MTLVERLRSGWPNQSWLQCLEAADRIEQLERELIKIRDCPGYCCSECGTIARRALEGKLPEVLITPKVAALTVEHAEHIAPPKTSPSES